MSNCFVIQPFDRGRFDKRYDDVFAPAIESARLTPYRVDRDPSVDVPIDNIEAGIRSAVACLADITTDNPNVWFELGFAIATAKDVVLVCSSERTTRFPFDVQHRNIIQYSPESPSDFETLSEAITARLKAIQSKQAELKGLSSMSSPVRDTEGLPQHEVVALAVAMQNSLMPGQAILPRQVVQDMNGVGFTDVAVSLALDGLLRKGMLQIANFTDHRGEEFRAYMMTAQGVAWLHSNQERIALEKPRTDEVPF